MEKYSFIAKLSMFVLSAFFAFCQSNDSLTGTDGSITGRVTVKNANRIQVTIWDNSSYILIYKDADYSAPESVIAKLDELYNNKDIGKFYWAVHNRKTYLTDIIIKGKQAALPEVMGGKKYEDDKKDKDDPVAKKGIETANKRLNNFSSMERVKMEYETNIAAAKKEYEEKNYLASIQNYQLASKFASKLNKEKDVSYLIAEIKRIENLVESSRKVYLDSASRFADAKDWLNMAKELRDCLRIDPENRKAMELLEKYQTEIFELRDKVYLDGLEAYGREDIDTAILKWNDVLILDPSFEKAGLNIKKAARKKGK